MRVLIACEFSGVVRDAFAHVGADAWSCDLLPSDVPGQHITGDALEAARAQGPWDLMIGFPPCTHLCVSGARWWSEKQAEQADALRFVRALWEAPVPRVAIENPIGILSTAWRKPDQIVHPWQYGHGETKATCLWLRGLPPLMVGVVDTGRYPRTHLEPPGPDRWKRRSTTYAGVAEAMAAQWYENDRDDWREPGRRDRLELAAARRRERERGGQLDIFARSEAERESAPLEAAPDHPPA